MVLVLWLGKQYVRNYTHLHDSNPSPSGCVYLLVESSSRSVADGFASRKQEENAHTYR